MVHVPLVEGIEGNEAAEGTDLSHLLPPDPWSGQVDGFPVRGYLTGQPSLKGRTYREAVQARRHAGERVNKGKWLERIEHPAGASRPQPIGVVKQAINLSLVIDESRGRDSS